MRQPSVSTGGDLWNLRLVPRGAPADDTALLWRRAH